MAFIIESFIYKGGVRGPNVTKGTRTKETYAIPESVKGGGCTSFLSGRYRR